MPKAPLPACGSFTATPRKAIAAPPPKPIPTITLSGWSFGTALPAPTRCSAGDRTATCSIRSPRHGVGFCLRFSHLRPFRDQLDCVSMPLHLQRQDHTEHFVGGVVFAGGVWTEGGRAPTRRVFPVALFHRNRNPATVFLDFIAPAAGPDGSRAAIHQIAARSFPIGPSEGAVEPPMPFVVALAGITFWRRR